MKKLTFNGETMTVTLQMIKIQPIKRAFINLKVLLVMLTEVIDSYKKHLWWYNLQK